MTVIQVDNLNKSYGNHHVLSDVSFGIQPGRLIGFLGPNGAGKTTTIRILLGLLRADSGTAKIFGQPCRQNGKQIRADVGYLPGDVHLYPNLRAYRLLDFFAAARRTNAKQEYERLASVFDLDLSRKIRKFSTGMRQKLGLIQAMMHRPNLLILDEPTSALDPLVRKSVFAELKKVVEEGRSVLFSSHSLDEVEELCDEVIILRQGRIVEQQQIETLKNRALKRVEMTLAADCKISRPVPESLQTLRESENGASFTWAGDIQPLLSWLQQMRVVDLTVERPDLNDLFLTYYQKSSTQVKEAKESNHV